MKICKIVFMGTPEFAVPALSILIERKEEITGVVTQPDRPVGRGQKIQPSPIKKLALKNNLPILQPESSRDRQFIQLLKTLSPDLVVVVAYGQIFPRSLLEIPEFGFVNVHSSLLPAYRGSAPINRAIINGETLTGITVMRLDEGMDTGDIILQESTPILPNDNALTLHDRLSTLGAKLLAMSLDMLLSEGCWSPVPQNRDEATYAPMLKKADGLIDWKNDARSISNQVRGMFPWPGCFSYLNGKMLKVHGAVALEENSDDPPGRIVSATQEGIKVSTGRGILLLTEIQLEGKKKMLAEQFIKGLRLVPGTEFTSAR